MPLTTAKSYPYPAPSDPVANGDDAIKDLAEFINNKVTGAAVTVNLINSTTAFVDVAFPTTYSAAPVVVATSTNAHYICGITNITTTQFRLTVQRRDATALTAGVVVMWLAIPN